MLLYLITVQVSTPNIGLAKRSSASLQQTLRSWDVAKDMGRVKGFALAVGTEPYISAKKCLPPGEVINSCVF